jgi:hypothetical protein
MNYVVKMMGVALIGIMIALAALQVNLVLGAAAFIGLFWFITLLDKHEKAKQKEHIYLDQTWE